MGTTFSLDDFAEKSQPQQERNVVVKKSVIHDLQSTTDHQVNLLEAAVTEGTRQFNETREDIIKVHADVNALHERDIQIKEIVADTKKRIDSIVTRLEVMELSLDTIHSSLLRIAMRDEQLRHAITVAEETHENGFTKVAIRRPRDVPSTRTNAPTSR